MNATVKALLGRTRVFLVHTDIPLPLGPETTIEYRIQMFGGLRHRRGHLIYCFKTVVFIFHMSVNVIISAELQFSDTTRWHFENRL